MTKLWFQAEKEKIQQALMSKSTGGGPRGSMGPDSQRGRRSSQRGGGNNQPQSGEDGWSQVPQRTGKQLEGGRMDSNKLLSLSNKMVRCKRCCQLM